MNQSVLLGVPTLNRYDLLQQLIASAEAGDVKPKGYVIIDNGGTLERNPNWPTNVEIIRPGRNLGVAASWNVLLRLARDEAIVIANDDLTLGPTSFREILEALEGGALLVNACGFALFAQTPECTRRVGYYDETFYPAYYEDTDYEIRCRIAEVHRVQLQSSSQHVGWGTSRALNDKLSQHFSWQRKNYEYYTRKWGGELGRERYRIPFNGATTAPEMTPPSMEHWDILNFVARRIAARRYLEIGSRFGECLARVDVPEKWGVDPLLTDQVINMVRKARPPAASALFRMTSLAFFDNVVAPEFDLIFIDGDHRAELVYEEVTRAVPLLSPIGVIVLHDCNPPNEEVQRVPFGPGDLPTGSWTGDVWKAIVRLRREGTHDVYTVDTDWGCGILRPYRGRPMPDLPAEGLTFPMLEENRQAFLGLISLAEFLERF